MVTPVASELAPQASTLLEWDANIPDFAVVHREAKKALRHRPAVVR